MKTSTIIFLTAVAFLAILAIILYQAPDKTEPEVSLDDEEFYTPITNSTENADINSNTSIRGPVKSSRRSDFGYSKASTGSSNSLPVDPKSFEWEDYFKRLSKNLFTT